MTIYLVPGAIVASRYRLERLLGEGGMGVVWAAAHLATGKPVALKLLRPGTGDDDAMLRRRFLREARAATAVHHPNVLEIQEALQLEDGTPVLVMDLLQGESLRDKLLREGRIPLLELSILLLPVISAVGTAHARGIIHRDLKPDNIFLVAADEAAGACVKVLDFGIAKLVAAEGEAARTTGFTDTGALLGTPYYMSPEQILGEPDVDHRADIWSLGVILYECITAVRPTEADSIGKVLKRILTGSMRPLGEIAPDLPAEVATMIDRMLSPERSRRPADLREVGAQLDRVAAIGFLPFGAPIAPVAVESRTSLLPAEPRAAAALMEEATSSPTIANIADPLRGKAQLTTLRAGSVPPPGTAAAGAPACAATAARPDATNSAFVTLKRRATGAGWKAMVLFGVLVASVAVFFLLRGP